MANRLIERLGLNEELIIRDLEVNFSLGEIYVEKFPSEAEHFPRSQSDAFLLAATHFRRAGLQALLLGDLRRAVSAFNSATQNYDRLDFPYGALTFSMTGDRDGHWGHARSSLLEEHRNNPWYSKAFRRQRVYPLLAFAAAERNFDDLGETFRSIRLELEAQRDFPIGVLGMHLGEILDLVDSLAPGFQFREIQARDALAPLIHRYSSALRWGRSNLYHWNLMTMPFHPAEPDVFGLFGMVEDALQRKFDINLVNFFEVYPLPAWEKDVLLYIYQGLPRERPLS